MRTQRDSIAAIRTITEWLCTHDLHGTSVMHAGILYGRPVIVLHDVAPLRAAYPEVVMAVSHHESSDCYEFDADGIHFEAWISRDAQTPRTLSLEDLR